MTPLSLTVPLGEGETATSFASRLGQRNGSRYVQDFVQDMGLTWPAIIAGDTETLAELAALGGADPTRLAGHAIQLHDEYRRRVGQAIVPRRILRHIRQHVCPLCLQDLENHSFGPPITWQFEPVRCCPEHGVLLIALREVEPPRSIYDLAGRVHDGRIEIRQARREQRAVTIGAFDRYISERLLRGRQGASWLDGCSLDVVWRVCETLGIILLYGPVTHISGLDAIQLMAAATAGFEAIGTTKTDFAETLRSMHQHSPVDRGGFYCEFQPFANRLGRLDGAPGFAEILETIRDFMEETYPFEPGEDILGRPCRRRQVHSVSSAARACGANTSRMQRLVETVVATPGHLGLPPPTRNLWLDAKAWDPFLRRYARARNPKAAAAHLGLRPEMFKRMAESGWVDPVFSCPGFVNRYDADDLQAILDGLFRRCQTVTTVEKDMAPVLKACAKSQCDVLTILGLVRDDRLAFVGRLPAVIGIPALVIRPLEVREVRAGPKVVGYTRAELRTLLGANTPTVSWLIKAGLIACEMGRHPKTNHTIVIVTQNAVDAFSREFVTLSQIARRDETPPKHAAALLARRDVYPIDMPSLYSKVYRRAEVDRI